MNNVINFSKLNGLVPAVIQDAETKQVLMVGFMSEEALAATRRDGLVTFWSRTKQRLWRKGETSGNVLEVVSIVEDCDHDSLLITVHPRGPVCHTGSYTCFGEQRGTSGAVIETLEAIIRSRHAEMPEGSYTAKLFTKGIQKIAQKVGEEGVETAIAAVSQDDERVKSESADLLYHLLVMLRARGIEFGEIAGELKKRMK